MTPKAGARWWDQPQLFASPEVPWTDRRLLGFDLETTDADPLIAQPVSYSFVEFRGRTPIARRKQIVVPKVPVSAGAEAVHGITKEVIERLGVPLETALGSIFEVLTRASEAQVPVVGMNLRFDLIIADTLAARFLGRGLLENGWRGPVIDVSVLDRHCDKWRKGSRTLPALCMEYGVDPGDSHDSDADASAAVNVALAIADRYPTIAKASPVELMGLQAAWREEWFESFSDYRMRNGQAPLDEAERTWPLGRELASAS